MTALRRALPGPAGLRRALPVAVAAWPVLAVIVLAPRIAPALGTTPDALVALALAQALAVALVAVACGAWGAPWPGRVAAAASTLGGAVAAVAASPWELAGALALAAVGQGVALALLLPLSAVAFRAAESAGLAAGALVLAGLEAAGASWRASLLALALGALLATAAAVAPGVVRPSSGLTFGEVARGLGRVPTVRRLLSAHAALGCLLVAVVPLLLRALEDGWSLGPTPRVGVLASAALVGLLALALLRGDGERLLERGPSTLLRATALVLALGAGALATAMAVPSFGAAVALLCAGAAGLALAQAAMGAVLMATVDTDARRTAAALAAAAASGVGGLLGLLVATGVAADLGSAPALAGLGIPAALAALALRGAAASADADRASVHGRADEETRIVRARDAGRRPPLLAGHGLVVEFGHRRALDGVDVAVAEGELLVLLGTNGAGKSTLLRVLSGLVPPVAGSVRLEGRDITLLDPERRFALGLGHVDAGAAVFDSLRVEESLRLAARAAGAARGTAEDAYARFPRLDERRSSRVAALSGGERQMLALAQVLLRRPRVLLVDELSLGLAPGVVAQLLDAVRAVHAQGTTVVVVEQSVDRGLAIATRAIFLERGLVRFDGPPAALRARTDLLRPVFLAPRVPAGGAA